MAVATLTNEQVENVSEAIERALWSYPSLRSDDMPISFDLHLNGTVEVNGNVRSRTIKEGVLELIGSVRGVDQVIDNVYADPELERAIAERLLTDERTAYLSPGAVQVFGHRGVMVLVGDIKDAAEIPAVLDMAASVEGVVKVVDRLRASQ